LYHNNTEEYEGYRIVGFEVYPSRLELFSSRKRKQKKKD